MRKMRKMRTTLTPNEIDFINEGFYIISQMENGDEFATVDPIEGIYIRLTGNEIASLIVNMLDKYYTLKT